MPRIAITPPQARAIAQDVDYGVDAGRVVQILDAEAMRACGIDADDDMIEVRQGDAFTIYYGDGSGVESVGLLSEAAREPTDEEGNLTNAARAAKGRAAVGAGQADNDATGDEAQTAFEDALANIMHHADAQVAAPALAAALISSRHAATAAALDRAALRASQAQAGAEHPADVAAEAKACREAAAEHRARAAART